jgi:MFS family permease
LGAKLSQMMWNRRRELLVVALMNVIYAFSYFQRVAVPGTIYNELQSAFAASAASVALLGGIYLYVYGGMQIFSGVLVDRFGPVRVIVVGGVLLGVGSILFPLGNTILQLYVTRALVGLGASLMFLSVVKELDISFNNRHFSALLSSSIFAGYAGGLMGTMPFEGAVRAFGWRPSLLVVGVACFIAVMITVLLTRRELAKKFSGQSSSVFPSIRRIFTNRHGYPVLFSSMVVFANFFLVQAIIGKKLLEDCCGLGASAAASYTFMLMLVSMSAIIFSGFLSKMMRNRRKPILVVTSFLAVLAPCMGLLILNKGAVWILPCYLLFGISSGGTPIFSTIMKELNIPDYAASSVGLINTAAYLAVAIYTTASGIVLDKFSSQAVRVMGGIHYPPAAYATIFSGLIVIALLSFISSLFIKETYGKNTWNAGLKS